jgi:hypothetical protein
LPTRTGGLSISFRKGIMSKDKLRVLYAEAIARIAVLTLGIPWSS